MKRYRVHIYPVVRVAVEVEANSQQEAITKATDETDLYTAIRNGEYAEDIDAYLVDECDDTEHEHSRWYDKQGNPEEVNKMTNPKLDALKALVSTIDEDACSCASRSWYGQDHDTACPLTYVKDAEAAIRELEENGNA